jgi:hypothetical protein
VAAGDDKRGVTSPGKVKFGGGGNLEFCRSHSGVRAQLANPESRGEHGAYIWIPGSRLTARPGMTEVSSAPAEAHVERAFAAMRQMRVLEADEELAEFRQR